MRAFVGIPIPCPDSLERVLDELGGCGADLKVVPPRNLHITLKFLGEIPDTQAPVILERLRSLGLPTRYRAQIQDVGAFPNWRKLNVIWAGLKESGGEIAKSFVATEHMFAELGFPAEARPYAPHVTLARKRSDKGKDRLRPVLESHRNEAFGEVEIEGPILFRSHLGPKGPTYERLGGIVR